MPDIRNFDKYLEWLSSNQALFRQDKAPRKPPPHPGKILLNEYLLPRGITQMALSQKIRCSFAKVSEIVHGKRRITPAFALDLEKVLGAPGEMWLSLQARYDLWEARRRTKDKKD